MRDAFNLDENVTHLNHGSYGAVPRVVAERQQAVRARAEANPMRFHRVDLPGLKVEAREVAAGLLRVAADDIALVRNVTEAVATVLANLAWQRRLGPGDVVLLGRQGYESVRRSVSHWCGRTGASYEVVDWPVDATAREVTAAYDDVLRTGRVRLLVVDQITSPTGSVLPVGDVCARAAQHGALTLVDGAHVPGQLDVVPSATGADFWTGTWHKWGFAPRGTSVLWVSEPERERLSPLTTSWNHGQQFPLPFDTHGTDDYSGWLSLETAAAFWQTAGGLGIAERSRAMLDDAADLLRDALGTSTPGPVTPAPCLRMVPLPQGVADTEASADALYESLSSRNLETQVLEYDGQGWLRLSGALYNEPADYELLAKVLPEALAALSR